jgi:hypothetical protein
MVAHLNHRHLDQKLLQMGVAYTANSRCPLSIVKVIMRPAQVDYLLAPGESFIPELVLRRFGSQVLSLSRKTDNNPMIILLRPPHQI